ncbi:phosphoribosylanthranilate isomerase [Natrarchaeobius oligotrophus]|uniref:N-(5'-phosphoribosyl)anthranilate isomerase n=1 Tax=Natrarchaeobius chitinivorans TaxID=1679083 RepID=A0A3N6M0X4_NATCH|nr:phosphoribosylanthranilate isomerase [Natrarchaeobius chitinivorans]RQG96938.1 phosphoribosylanthranilate isomerase [Natrarchaeobius chitinivorans]
MTRVKICGLTTEADLEIAVDAGADAVGVIADVPVDTPRDVSTDRAATLVASAPPFVTTVLVTMARSSDPDRITDLVSAVEPDVLQLHGVLELDDPDDLAARIDREFVAAIDADEVTEAARFDDLVDAFLVDTPAADGGGGTGRTHDWDRTRAAADSLESPTILAGGLTPENVAEAVRTVEPFAVDVASGVEATGGVKDDDAVRSFVARAKAARSAEPIP